jgi:hypothetical protein
VRRTGRSERLRRGRRGIERRLGIVPGDVVVKKARDHVGRTAT